MGGLQYGRIGQRIRRARKQKGWTQQMLAEKCSISLSFVGHIERGTRYMSLDTFAVLCDTLEIDAEELLWGPRPEEYGLPDMWKQSKLQNSGNYGMYTEIMKSVAQIMSSTSGDGS